MKTRRRKKLEESELRERWPSQAQQQASEETMDAILDQGMELAKELRKAGKIGESRDAYLKAQEASMRAAKAILWPKA